MNEPSESDKRLGALLIKKRLITYQQLTHVLEFQKKLISSNRMPIGEILIQFGLINRNSLNETLKEQEELNKKIQVPPPPPPPTISKDNESPFSKSQGFLLKPSFNKNSPPPPPPPQVNQPVETNLANRVSAKVGNINNQPDKLKHRPIGEMLVEKGYIDKSQLSKALQYQSSLPPTHFKPIGEVLIDLSYITREQLESVLNVQAPANKNSIGEILKQLGIIDASQLSMVLAQEYSIGGKSVMTGDLLLQHGFITKAQLDLALEEQKKRS